MITGSGKRECEAMVSPVKKIVKVHNTSDASESFSSPIPTMLNLSSDMTSSTSKSQSNGTTSTTNFPSPPAAIKKQQWPYTFSLQEVVNGLTQLHKLRKSGCLQEDAFFKVFGVKCVRETLQLKMKFLESC